MEPLRVQESAVIHAPAARIYGILADYRDGHPRILPKSYFSNLEVEQGGYGEGTIIRFELRLLGARRQGRMEVHEPEPGRVLTETDPETGTVTTFTLRPLDTGARTYVTIVTVMPVRPGVFGIVKRTAAAAMLRRIYAEELELLARMAAEAS
jgi:hypothetical protein